MGEHQRFGRYTLDHRLGSGGMAEVHLAHDDHGQAVAIKRLLSPYSANADFKAMFIDEARIGTLLSHPNVARVLELGEHEGQLYLVMEHVEGCDLLQPAFGIGERPGVAGSGLPLGIVAHIGSGIAAGLAYAHSLRDARGELRGIVHRDVSPANVLVGFDGIPRLIDFGIAKARDRLAQTMGDVVKGKFAYMSPEQINGQPVDGRSDIFALGAVIFALLTGREAFRGGNQLVTIQRVSLAQAPPPSSLVESLPRDIDDVVGRALARDPAERYQDADELRRDLLTVAAKQQGARFGAMAMSAWMYEQFGDEEEDERESISDAQRALSASAHLGPVSQPLPALSTGDIDIGVDQYDSTQLAGHDSVPPEEATVLGELGELGEHTVLDRDAAARIRSKLGALGSPRAGAAATDAARGEKTVRRVHPSFADEQPTVDAPTDEGAEAGTTPSGLPAQATVEHGSLPEMPADDLWDGDSRTRATLGFEDDGEATFVPSASAIEDDPIELLRREADDELSGRVDWHPAALEAPDASDRTVANFADATAPTRTEEATVARLADDDADTAGGQRGRLAEQSERSSGVDDFDDETAQLAHAALDETMPLAALDTDPHPRASLPPQAFRDDDPRARSSPLIEDGDEDLLGADDDHRSQTLTGASLSSLLDDDDDDDDDDERVGATSSLGRSALAQAGQGAEAGGAAEATTRPSADEPPEREPSSAIWVGLIVVLAIVGMALVIYLLR